LYIGSNQLLSYEQGFGKYFGHGAVLEIQNENRIFRFNNKGEKDNEFVLIRSNLSNASFMPLNANTEDIGPTLLETQKLASKVKT